MLFKIFIKKNRAFTLLEIIITMTIFSLIMGVVGYFARDIFKNENIFSNGLSTYDEARKVLQPISSEIRSASPSSLGAYPLEVIGDTNFIFFADINNDGLKERIRYYLSGSTLMKGVITPSGNPLQYLSGNEKITEIVHNVANGSTPLFAYYDFNYNGNSLPLTQPVSIINVRLIKITLIIDADPNRPPAPVTVSTQISIRNLKDNL
ncbi:MAG TPA: prepilin-type N-terminal cleavage/methylation domain-containing protein [Candidatus Paceibacterota bacterium]